MRTHTNDVIFCYFWIFDFIFSGNPFVCAAGHTFFDKNALSATKNDYAPNVAENAIVLRFCGYNVLRECPRKCLTARKSAKLRFA